jgi:ADP-ribosyl-[dinitrogen reductase] hydrolase
MFRRGGLTGSTASIQQRALGAYLGLAVGDALGATVEFMTPAEIRATYGVHNCIIGGGWLRLRPGQVTDDTTMTLSLGRSIIEHGHVDAMHVAQAFDAWMRAKPVDIGNTVRRGILHFRNTGDPVSPHNEHSAGNGACMRCLPVALATLNRPWQEVVSGNRAQAHITHNNELSDAGTECVITMIQEALRGGSLTQLEEGPVKVLIECHPQFAFHQQQDNPTGYIVHTLRTVFHALHTTNDFESCLVNVVNRGGDADTTGAIAGMIAGAAYGVEAIPPRWVKALDATVAAACQEQAMALLCLSH